MDKSQSKSLSQVELALLQLVAEKDHLSGYQINTLIRERGYREWANIGETSVYVGLEKLSRKGLVEASIQTDKQGKGPLPKNFHLTGQGMKVLKAEVVNALSAARERDRRFDLALVAAPLLDGEEVLQALSKRKAFLFSEKERINRQYLKQGGAALPAHVQLLFKHTLIHIEAELGFSDEVSNAFKATQEDHRVHPEF